MKPSIKETTSRCCCRSVSRRAPAEHAARAPTQAAPADVARGARLPVLRAGPTCPPPAPPPLPPPSKPKLLRLNEAVAPSRQPERPATRRAAAGVGPTRGGRVRVAQTSGPGAGDLIDVVNAEKSGGRAGGGAVGPSGGGRGLGGQKLKSEGHLAVLACHFRS